jgi:hypothetical protein
MGGTYYFYKQQFQKEAVPKAVSVAQLQQEHQTQDSVGATPTTGSTSSTSTKNVEPPDELNLSMTFYPQAPFADWDYPWQEACEEASILLVANTYFDHNWTREQFRDQILDLVDWETREFGDYKHTNVLQNVQILRDKFGLKTEVMNNPTFGDVQQTLAKGHLIIGFFAGRQLNNPNYKNGGPVYHAFVIKGYKTGEKIIAHDVGTKRGEDFVYPWATLKNAMHDYAEPIDEGAQRMIEVLPPNL